MSSQNHQQENRLISLVRSLSYNQMRGKLAGALLYLSDSKYTNEGVFEFLSRQDIADFAGISLESTVKFLKEFAKENMIDLDGRHLIISNKEALEDLSLHA
jgi:CRP/FNR family transcriptional regulator